MLLQDHISLQFSQGPLFLQITPCAETFRHPCDLHPFKNNIVLDILVYWLYHASGMWKKDMKMYYISYCKQSCGNISP